MKAIPYFISHWSSSSSETYCFPFFSLTIKSLGHDICTMLYSTKMILNILLNWKLKIKPFILADCSSRGLSVDINFSMTNLTEVYTLTILLFSEPCLYFILLNNHHDIWLFIVTMYLLACLFPFWFLKS